MAEGIISYPFRLTAQGTVAVTGYGTDQEVEEAIAVLILTESGERPMYPTFGVPDTGFAGLSPGDVQVGLNVFGPSGIIVTGVDLVPVNDTQAVANVLWTRGTAAGGVNNG